MELSLWVGSGSVWFSLSAPETASRVGGVNFFGLLRQSELPFVPWASNLCDGRNTSPWFSRMACVSRSSFFLVVVGSWGTLGCFSRRSLSSQHRLLAVWFTMVDQHQLLFSWGWWCVSISAWLSLWVSVFWAFRHKGSGEPHRRWNKGLRCESQLVVPLRRCGGEGACCLSRSVS